jgi:rhodanese-related sulfurtransferase
MAQYATVTVTELSVRLQRGERVKFIDVRELPEWEIARVEGAELFPMSTARDWIGTLDPADEIVVMCHHGIRSAQVCRYLASEGFGKVSNLEGGIESWSREVDPAVPRY